MTNKAILQIAMEQSALDINCNAESFLFDRKVLNSQGKESASLILKRCALYSLTSNHIITYLFLKENKFTIIFHLPITKKEAQILN